MMYDDNVWWSYMMITHEFIYDDHRWSSYMIILYAHPIWSWDMTIIYDHHTWSSYMRMIYDHHTWSSYMMIIYDHHTWSSFMIIIHDHHESIRVTCFTSGVAYDMEKYLEEYKDYRGPRTDKISIFAPIEVHSMFCLHTTGREHPETRQDEKALYWVLEGQGAGMLRP